MPRTLRVFFKDYSWFDVYCVAMFTGMTTILATLPLCTIVKSVFLDVLPIIVLFSCVYMIGYAKLYNYRYVWERGIERRYFY